MRLVIVKDERARYRGKSEDIADADIAVTVNGQIIKDRNGDLEVTVR